MNEEAAIRVACPCGKAYSVPARAIGKKVRCRACDTEFTCARPIEAMPATKACASCQTQIPTDKIICPQCDFNHRTGKNAKRTSPQEYARMMQPKAPKPQPKWGESARQLMPSEPARQPQGRAGWGVDVAALSAGAGSMLLGLFILGVGLLFGRIMIFGLVFLVIGMFGVVKGLVGQQGIW